ncbi:hypothetical protein BD769DRAFT_1038204 [Suillus cothurnatus]|nr:hypothetical protein BD769DRAFT_1038204 [Suillus cothurnatus]
MGGYSSICVNRIQMLTGNTITCDSTKTTRNITDGTASLGMHHRASRSITRQALSQRRHVTQNSVVLPGADNGHQDALQQPAPRRITPVPSCTLANALRPDIRGIPEPCLWPAQHTAHTYIPAHRVVTSEFDDSLVPLHLTHIPILQFSTLDGALCG